MHTSSINAFSGLLPQTDACTFEIDKQQQTYHNQIRDKNLSEKVDVSSIAVCYIFTLFLKNKSYSIEKLS